jgi:hypothetical protein
MTSPALHRDKSTLISGLGARDWLALALGILAEGVASALVAFLAQKKDLALGLFLGSLCSFLNFRALYVLSVKLLKPGERGRKLFWFWTLARWMVIAFICWFLVRLSPACLLGALFSYLWSLAVLAWVGWKGGSSRRPL